MVRVARRDAAVLVGILALLAVLLSPGVGSSGDKDTSDGLKATLIDVHPILKAKDSARPGSNVANCSNAGNESGTYVYTGWKIGGDRTAYLNAATVPSYLGDVRAAMQDGFSVWSQADAAAPRVTVTTGSTVTKQTANRTYDLLFGKAGGTTLAVTYTWRWSDGFVESDTVFNTSVSWTQFGSEGDGCYETVPRYDLQNIAAHEFGHSYGLGHPSGARFETMYAYGYSGETLKRSTAAGDRAGIAALY